MRTSNKARLRGKNNRRPSGNMFNRVFDSSGPNGNVRGNLQQIIEKYQGLSRDALLSGDRIAAENFAQHSEHYSRLLGEAHREQEARREQQEAQANQRRIFEEADNGSGTDNFNGKGDGMLVERQGSGLVDTPEDKKSPATITRAADGESRSSFGVADGTRPVSTKS